MRLLQVFQFFLLNIIEKLGSLVKGYVKINNPISHLPTLVNKPFSIYFDESSPPLPFLINKSIDRNIFALKSEAKMEKYYEELRRTKELNKINQNMTEKIEFGNDFKEENIKENQCNFVLAKTKKKINDINNQPVDISENWVGRDFFNKKQLNEPIYKNNQIAKCQYAGSFFIYYFILN